MACRGGRRRPSCRARRRPACLRSGRARRRGPGRSSPARTIASALSRGTSTRATGQVSAQDQGFAGRPVARLSEKARSRRICARIALAWMNSPCPISVRPAASASPATRVAGREQKRRTERMDIAEFPPRPPALRPALRTSCGGRRSRSAPRRGRRARARGACGSPHPSPSAAGAPCRRCRSGAIFAIGGRLLRAVDEIGVGPPFLGPRGRDPGVAGAVRPCRTRLPGLLAEDLVEVPAGRQVQRHVGAGEPLRLPGGSASCRPRRGSSGG